MRTFTIRRTVLAAAVMTAALATSACGITDTGKGPSPDAAGKKPSAPAAAPASSSPGKPATEATSTGGKQATGGTNSATSTGTSAGGKHRTGGTQLPKSGQTKAVTCTGSNTRVVVNRPSRPINHLLLTATNKGSVPCDVYSAPLLRFDDEQAATAIDESTQQQSVIRLAPGQSAYASVLLMTERTGSEVHGRTTTKLGVHFASRDASGSVGPSVPLALPADTYKTDDAKTTHWVNNLNDALAY